jgi:tRNA pseudouridine38-40 synthase
MRLAFRFAYLGDRFCGSQMQAAERTVEGEFVAACTRLQLFENWRDAGFLVAGRTDRGVHARGQVCALTTVVPDRAIAGINWQLPPDLWCTGYAEVDPGFHPRYDARKRTYRYYFGDPSLDIPAMESAAGMFIGRHDFSGVSRASDKNPVRRVLSVHIGKEEGYPFFEVTAESYLWHMVRYMASAIGLIGSGRADEDLIRELLDGSCRVPLPPAPAEGLILWDVDCGIAWNPIPIERRARSHLESCQRHHLVMKQICTLLGNQERE